MKKVLQKIALALSRIDVVVQTEPQKFCNFIIFERKPVDDAGNQFVVDGVYSIAELWKIL